MKPMKIVQVDLNARTADDKIRLTLPVTQNSIQEVGAELEEWVWLQDEDQRVLALLGTRSDPNNAIPLWNFLQTVNKG